MNNYRDHLFTGSTVQVSITATNHALRKFVQGIRIRKVKIEAIAALAENPSTTSPIARFTFYFSTKTLTTTEYGDTHGCETIVLEFDEATLDNEWQNEQSIEDNCAKFFYNNIRCTRPLIPQAWSSLTNEHDLAYAKQ